MAGSAAGRSWRSLSLPWKVFLGGGVALLLLLGLVFVLLARWTQRSGDAIVRRELEQSSDLVAQYLSARQRSLAGGARVFVQDPNFRSFVHEHLRDEVRDQALEAQEQLEANWTFVVDESGILLAKSDEPSAGGANMGGVPLVSGALQGRVTTGFGVSGDTMLFQAVAVPIVVPGQAPIGALVATRAVDSALARDVEETTSSEIVFYSRGDDGPHLVATSFDRSQRPQLGAEVTAQTRSRVVVNGVRYATHSAAVATAGGDIIGGYVVMSARDAASAEIAEVRRSLLIAALAGFALLGAAAFAMDRHVARPLRELAALARTESSDADRLIAEGTNSSDDEVAALTIAVESLVDDVRDRATLSSAVSAALPGTRASAAASVEAPVLSMRRVQGAPARAITSTTRSGAPDPAAPAAESAAGAMIAGRYRIDGVLGAGELGTTYRARDRATGSVVALKQFNAGRLGEDDGVRLADALREELRTTRHFVHRNVVRLREVGEESGTIFVTMDLVEGMSLAALLRSGNALPEDAVLSLARQLCRALAAAERAGAVHGHMSPHHVLLGYDGLLKVTDFTLARFERRLRRGRGTAMQDATGRSGQIPQLAGATVGTPEYMSPEQLIGEEPTPQADVYAAGVVLYECVTGATPFRTDSPLAFLAQKLGDAELASGIGELDRARPARGATPRLLSEVIARMIAPDPAKRARSAGELLALLERAG